MNKYEILENDTLTIGGLTVCRIRALRDFGDVKAGELGGYISSESNLSHEGNCWVYDQAAVFQIARVADDAQVRNNALVYGSAKIRQTAIIKDNARVRGSLDACYNIVIGGGRVVDSYGDVKITPAETSAASVQKELSDAYASNIYNRERTDLATVLVSALGFLTVWIYVFVTFGREWALPALAYTVLAILTGTCITLWLAGTAQYFMGKKK